MTPGTGVGSAAGTLPPFNPINAGANLFSQPTGVGVPSFGQILFMGAQTDPSKLWLFRSITMYLHSRIHTGIDGIWLYRRPHCPLISFGLNGTVTMTVIRYPYNCLTR